MAEIKIEITSRTAVKALAELGTSEKFIGPALDDIGASVVEKVRALFRASQDPYGKPWAPLKVRRGKPLLDTGVLRNSITHAVVGAESVMIGTNVKYAPYHQFGATRKQSRTANIVLRFNSRGRFKSKKAAASAKKSNRVGFATQRFAGGVEMFPARPFLPVGNFPDAWAAVIGKILARRAREIAEVAR